MGIWHVASVAEQPEVTLVRWRIVETDSGERHIVGYHVAGREGRVSSAIVNFDPSRRRGRTRSGRIYQLCGAPDYDRDADYVWCAWQRINAVASWRDVTTEAWVATAGTDPAENGDA